MLNLAGQRLSKSCRRDLKIEGYLDEILTVALLMLLPIKKHICFCASVLRYEKRAARDALSQREILAIGDGTRLKRAAVKVSVHYACKRRQ